MRKSENDNLSLTERTVADLRRMVRESGLEAGARFANEADLMEKLGISRSILREAINRLKAFGLLESLQGVGLIIGNTNPLSSFEEAFSMVTFSEIQIGELAELRYALEVGAVDFVVQRITPKHLNRLKEIADKMVTCERDDDVGCEIDDLELEFHKTYLKSSGNAMLTKMHKVITAYFHRAPKEIADWSAGMLHEGEAWTHHALIQALREKSVERARAVISGHLKPYSEK